jgi:hypothetical protein
MMSEIWGINSSFYLLLGLGDDVSNGYVELECGGMSFAHYVLNIMWSVLDFELGENVYIYTMYQRQKMTGSQYKKMDFLYRSSSHTFTTRTKSHVKTS